MSNIQFVKHRRFWYTISTLQVVISIIFIAIFGLKLGLDFTGGSLLELSYAKARPDTATIQQLLATNSYSNVRIQSSGDNDVIIRMPEITEDAHQKLLKAFSDQAVVKNKDNIITEKRFETFGSSIGNEIAQNAILAIALVLAAIICYLAYAFRKVTRPISSWKYGTVAVVALIHDVMIIIGLFSILGYFFGIEIDSFFITAVLTVIGFSVHDTIVTIDRIRENLFKHYPGTFETVVNDSINQTITRSINTSMTTLLSLVAIYFFGGASIQNFALALIAGIIVGTYSSVFVASPLLVTWNRFTNKSA